VTKAARSEVAQDSDNRHRKFGRPIRSRVSAAFIVNSFGGACIALCMLRKSKATTLFGNGTNCAIHEPIVCTPVLNHLMFRLGGDGVRPKRVAR